MTVNERLVAANLLDAYERAKAATNLAEINHVLAQVGLRQDKDGMNWSVDAPNR